MKKKVRAKAKKPAAKKSKSRKPAKAKRAPVKAAKKSKPASKSAKKPSKKKPVPPPPTGVVAPANSVLLGIVEDYFAKIGVIALTLKAPVAVGQKIQVLGHTTKIEQVVDSMQIEHTPVSQAGPNDSVGIKVSNRARGGDHVFLLK